MSQQMGNVWVTNEEGSIEISFSRCEAFCCGTEDFSIDKKLARTMIEELQAAIDGPEPK